MLDDIEVFFDPDDFARTVVRQRGAADDIEFLCIVGTADVEALDGNAIAVERKVQFPVNDVLEGDVLVIDLVPFRVLRVDLENDGAEMCAYLTDIV